MKNFVKDGFNWLYLHLDFFLPKVSNSTKETELKVKMLLEISCLCMLAKRGGISLDIIYKIMLEIRNFICSNKFLSVIIHEPKKIRLHGLVMVAVSKYFGSIDHIDYYLNQCFSSNFSIAHEELPFRSLEIMQIEEWAGIRFYQNKDWKNIYERTLPFNSKEIHLYENIDVYIFTHVIFYITNFGERNVVPAIMSDRELRNLHQTLEILTYIYLSKNDNDLLAEILICLISLKYKGGILKLIKENIKNNSRKDGSIIGPNFSVAEFEKMDNNLRTEYYITHNYHTTVVAILAFVFAEHNQ